MNEQGIAWMVAVGHHDPSPEESRNREHLRVFQASRPARPAIRERLAAIIARQQAAGLVATSALDCCAA